MPFPTIDGKTFQSLLEELNYKLPIPLDNPTYAILDDLFKQVDVVSTQLYDDVQRLKRLAKAHGWAIEDDDPSQTPI